jgi:hypothetical protein
LAGHDDRPRQLNTANRIFRGDISDRQQQDLPIRAQCIRDCRANTGYAYLTRVAKDEPRCFDILVLMTSRLSHRVVGTREEPRPVSPVRPR